MIMKLYRNILVLGTVAIGFVGCLKDNTAVLNPDNTTNVIEFGNTANLTSPTTSKYPLLSVNVLMQANGTLNAVVNYAGAFTAPEDITVTVGDADPAVLAAYNTQNKTTYLALPTANYTLPQKTVVIPKGGRKVTFPINLINSDQVYGKNYVLALAIKSASSGIISGNFNNMLYLLSGINKLDGIYELHFKFGTNDRGYDIFPVSWYYSDVQLVTASGVTSTMRNLNAGTSITTAVHAAVTAGLPSNIPAFIPLLTYDPVTFKITAVANNTVGTKTAILNPAVTDSRFDPATGNVYASFILKEAGKADMIIYDTLFLKSPR